MATNSYFSHDSNARNDQKIIRARMKHGAAGYGVYFMLLERLKEEADYSCSTDYTALAYDFHEDEALIKSIVEDFGLFELSEDGQKFYSQGFKDRMTVKDNARAALSEERRAAANKRWHKNDASIMQNDESIMQNDESIMQNDESIMQNDANKSKVKESKGKENIIKEKSSSSDNAHVGADDRRQGVFSFGISLDNCSLLKSMLEKETPETYSEALRLCSWVEGSGRDKANMVFGYIQKWNSIKEKNHQPFYEILQMLQGLETRGQIKPPSRNLWKAYAWVMGMSSKDRDTIFRLAKTEEDLETINECIKECSNQKKKIDNPGRYTIAALTKNK